MMDLGIHEESNFVFAILVVFGSAELVAGMEWINRVRVTSHDGSPSLPADRNSMSFLPFTAKRMQIPE